MKKPKISVSWEQGAPPKELEEEDIRETTARFLIALGLGGVAVNLLLAGDETLRGLNARFRDMDRPTDVLSWRYGPPASTPPPGGDAEEEPFGEIALSLERGLAQAGENGWDLRTELLRLLAHGCAHLAGFDHETPKQEQEMRQVEIALLKEAGQENIYPD